MSTFVRPLILAFLFLTVVRSLANASPPVGLVHVRGAILTVASSSIVVETSSGPVKIELPKKGGISEVIPSSRSQITSGSFVGIASTPNASGGQSAHEVVVFPESARGTGEGSYPWDTPGGTAGRSKMTNGYVGSSKMTAGRMGGSKMTNGTVAAATGGAVVVSYKSAGSTGQQTIAIPPGIPVVTFVPGSEVVLVPAAHVFVVGTPAAGSTIQAVRVLVGKDGLTPPM